MTRPSDAWARSARLAPTFRALVPMATASQSIGRPRHPRDIERGAERGPPTGGEPAVFSRSVPVSSTASGSNHGAHLLCTLRRSGVAAPVLLSVTAQSRGLGAGRRRYTPENAQQVVDCSCRRRANGDAIECRISCHDEDVERVERVDALSAGQPVDPCALTPSGMASPGRASR